MRSRWTACQSCTCLDGANLRGPDESCFRGLTGILLVLQLPLLPAYLEDCQATPLTGQEILARHERLLESPELLATSTKVSDEVGWGGFVRSWTLV